MQTGLSIHSVLSQAIKNAFSLNSRRPIKLPLRRISTRKTNPNTINLSSIILSKIRQRNSSRKALKIMNQLTMRASRIFISSIEKEIILTASTRKPFHQEISSLYICEEIVVRSSLYSFRKCSKHSKRFRIFLLTRLRHL